MKQIYDQICIYIELILQNLNRSNDFSSYYE